MKGLTIYFPPTTNKRFQRIREHLGVASFSQTIAQVLSVAERELDGGRTDRPWDDDIPCALPATRHTITLHVRSEERLDHLRQRFQQMDGPGVGVLRSTVVARAIALAEKPILAMTVDELELRRIHSDVQAMSVETTHLKEEIGEEAIARLVTLMRQTAELITRAQRVQQQNSSAWTKRGAWTEAAELIIGPLNDLMQRIAEAVRCVREATDARASGR